VNGKTWGITSPVVTDLVIGREGGTVAALGCVDNSDWQVLVDGRAWAGTWDMAWKPVISTLGGHVAVKVRKGKRETIVINGKPYAREFDQVFEPTFSPDGKKLLIRGIDKGSVVRIVADVAQA